MADNKKSILDEALLDAKRIQEALNANSKEILRSVSKEEIDNVVKESLEEGYVEEDVEDETELDVDAVDTDVDDVEMDIEAEPTVGDIESSEEGDDLEGDYESGMDAVASDDEVEMDMTTASDEDVISVYKKLTGDDEIEVVVDDEAGEVKLSVNEPGEFVIKTGEGEAEVEDEMPVDMDMDVDALDVDADGDVDAVAADIDVDADADAEMDVDAADVEDEDDVMYEIALDEETKIGATANGKPRTATSDVENSMTGDIETGDIDNVTAPERTESDDQFGGDTTDEGGDLGFDENQPHGKGEGQMVMNEDEDEEAEADLTEEEVSEGEDVDEQIGSGLSGSRGKHRNKTGGNSIAKDIKGPGAKLDESEVLTKYNTLLAEANELKNKNGEYKQALKQFRTMLAETVVFNSNLTYTTKLFMEHSTTKEEKEAIYKRFDNEVSTLKESKKLFKTIESELGSRKPITESVENKIIKEASSSKSTQLNESTAYVDKETSRIMDLMKRVNNR
jgi:hypothetical protein